MIKNPSILNLQFNELVNWEGGTKNTLTKRLMYQVLFLFHIDFGHSKLFKDKSKQFLKRILQEIARKKKYLEHQMLGQ